MYNQTNYTQIFMNPYISFNDTREMGFSLVNGTGTMNMGYLSTYTRIEGFDLLMQLELVQTVLLVILVLLVTFYVTLYYFRGLNDE